MIWETSYSCQNSLMFKNEHVLPEKVKRPQVLIVPWSNLYKCNKHFYYFSCHYAISHVYHTETVTLCYVTPITPISPITLVCHDRVPSACKCTLTYTNVRLYCWNKTLRSSQRTLCTIHSVSCPLTNSTCLLVTARRKVSNIQKPQLLQLSCCWGTDSYLIVWPRFFFFQL